MHAHKYGLLQAEMDRSAFEKLIFQDLISKLLGLFFFSPKQLKQLIFN